MWVTKSPRARHACRNAPIERFVDGRSFGSPHGSLGADRRAGGDRRVRRRRRRPAEIDAAAGHRDRWRRADPDERRRARKALEGAGGAVHDSVRVRIHAVRGGRVLQPGLRGRLLHVQEPRQRRDVLAGAPGHRSRRSLPDRGRDQLRHDRRVRRHRRVRALQRQRRRRVRRGGVHGFMRTTTGTCDSAGGCSGATTQSCTPYQCAPDGKTCRTSCMTDADCVAPNTCANNSCGKKPIGAACGADAECNSASVRRGGAARRPAPGRASRARWREAKGPAATCPTAGSARPVRRRGRHDLRAGRAVQRRRARAASTRRTPCAAWIHAARAPSSRRRCDAAGTCAAGSCDPAVPTCAARRTARPAARPAPTA